MKKISILCLLFCLGNLFASAQSGNTSNELPSWAKLMDDPQVNYYEALQAFEAYWQNREKPMNEQEQFKQAGREMIHKNTSIPDEIRWAYKRFMHWQEKMKPYVKPDGSLMSGEERIQEWKQQMASRKISVTK